MPMEAVHAIAAEQGGVVSRGQLYDAGVTRAQVRAQVRARRWRRVGSQAVALATGPLTRLGQFWAAVFEAGPRAFLDGASALEAAGLEHFHEPRIRVSVPRGARVRRARGLNIRQTRRWAAHDVVGRGVPRSRPPVAAVRAALWARSNKQAALILVLVVQQGLALVQEVAEEMLRVRRDRRRLFLHAVLLDLLGGVRSLGELEFARECRRRGIPEPTRQVVRRTGSGRYVLDVVWEQWGVVVEIDGIQHTWANQVVGDALRQNELVLTDAMVLRLPLLGLRVNPDPFFEQIIGALRARGCPLSGAAA
jgi:very-short-patch-repair endonuclease